MPKLKRVRRQSTRRKPAPRRPQKVEYTIREAAELRGVHPNTVRRKIRTGEVNAQLKFVELLRSNIYFIPHKELRKIKAESGGRPPKRS